MPIAKKMVDIFREYPTHLRSTQTIKYNIEKEKL